MKLILSGVAALAIVSLILIPLSARAQGSGGVVPSIAVGVIEESSRGMIDLNHIERNASYTTLAALYAFNDHFLGYVSWDTDDDGIIGGLYVDQLSEKVNLVGVLGYNDKKAGNHSITGLIQLGYAVGNGSIGAGLQLERGTDSRAADTIGKQDTLTYKLIGEYSFSKVDFEVIAEKYDYRNPTFKELNSTVPDENTSTAGLSAIIFEGVFTGFGNVMPYVGLKFKEFDGPLDDDEFKVGVRWAF